MTADGIAAIVVSHQSAASLEECVLRLRAAARVVEIRVVDNASDDGSVALVQRLAIEDPRVRFIANPDNPGFAVACNQGAEATRARWLAFVNPDCLVEADTLARMHDHALGFDAAVIGADLVDEAGARDAAARRRDPDFGAMLRDPSRARLGVPRDPALALQPVDAVSGALLLLPRALFARLDGFDEGYRLHAEDLDLCRRARAAGALVACANDATVLHLRGVSSRARPVFVEWHKHRGFWRYFRKFEASRRSAPMRAAVWALIWGRFPLAALRAWRAARPFSDSG